MREMYYSVICGQTGRVLFASTFEHRADCHCITLRRRGRPCYVVHGYP